MRQQPQRQAAVQRQVAALMDARVPLENMLPGLIASALLFPIVFQLVLALERGTFNEPVPGLVTSMAEMPPGGALP